MDKAEAFKYFTVIFNSMKMGTLICYTLGSETTQIQRNKLRKQLLGHLDHSNCGKYKYFRDGLLTKIPSIRLIRSAIIVKNKDAPSVLDILNEYKATVHVRTIVLTPEDLAKLEIAEKTEDG